MVLRRLVGLGAGRSQVQQPDHRRDDAAETATVRRIVAELEALPPDQRRYLAGFAYVLSRAAADRQSRPERCIPVSTFTWTATGPRAAACFA